MSLRLTADGSTVIQLGKHRFNINTQPLDLTVVNRDGVQPLPLESTKFFEAITDETFVATRAVWGQEVVTENTQVYRDEYLAWQWLKSRSGRDGGSCPPSLPHHRTSGFLASGG